MSRLFALVAAMEALRLSETQQDHILDAVGDEPSAGKLLKGARKAGIKDDKTLGPLLKSLTAKVDDDGGGSDDDDDAPEPSVDLEQIQKSMKQVADRLIKGGAVDDDDDDYDDDDDDEGDDDDDDEGDDEPMRKGRRVGGGSQSALPADADGLSGGDFDLFLASVQDEIDGLRKANKRGAGALRKALGHALKGQATLAKSLGAMHARLEQIGHAMSLPMPPRSVVNGVDPLAAPGDGDRFQKGKKPRRGEGGENVSPGDLLQKARKEMTSAGTSAGRRSQLMKAAAALESGVNPSEVMRQYDLTLD